ncbi:hypothetical protein [Flavobacterium sp. CYK-55]|uniref:hypothetical protein n=1 Tax=Flavobacterium sp. CYK-55 TaxID=2835529 RepID=UPI0020BF2A5C|nr:hypothetical protein [Flavobacterium sp. CYK-55]
MMRVFRIFVFLVLTTWASSAQAQVYKFLTTGFSVMERNERGEWGKWSDLKEASIVIMLDTNKNRFVVYSQEVQLYNIVQYQPEEENDTDIINAFSCSDDDGQPFTISIITRKNQGNRKQLYINQKDFIVVYNIVNHIDKNHQ